MLKSSQKIRGATTDLITHLRLRLTKRIETLMKMDLSIMKMIVKTLLGLLPMTEKVVLIPIPTVGQTQIQDGVLKTELTHLSVK